MRTPPRQSPIIVAPLLLLLALAATAHAAPPFVGSAACASCHAVQSAAWKGSHHDLAMQVPTKDTVLGDFANATFTKDGITTTFSRRNERFVIRTDGPGGKLADFEVKYVFGVTPLQQYLLETTGGRLQAFTIAWDTRSKAQGGQRWFDLYPKEKLRAGDELHWTGRQQNWNYMCADCHSTNLVKGYDAATDSFRTTWSEVNVGCEACHGPGDAHARWAKAGAKRDAPNGLTVALDERRGVNWIPQAATGIATRSKPRETSREIEVCAQCHARRAQIAEGYHAGRRFLDHYLPSLLSAGLYENDGQQRDEVYNWGSFLQSRMHAKGVTCSDCHDPHSAKVRAPGNSICAACHLPSRYDDAKHHFHKAGTKGAECASCHMPTRTYMVVDPRHDHSFRVPRPDLSVKLGTPNACNDCHRDRKAQWAAQAVARWHGDSRRQEWSAAEAFSAARKGSTSAEVALLKAIEDATVPSIQRATALAELAPFATAKSAAALRRSPAEADELMRLASARTAHLLPPRDRLPAFGPLLSDPRLAMRIEAAVELAGIPRQAFPPDQLAAFERAASEYRAVQANGAVRPEAWTSLGGFEQRLGNVEAAQRAYAEALKRDAAFIPARVNLADLYSNLGREADAEKELRAAVRSAPANASAHHALGLSLVRQKRIAEAMPELEKAATLAPDSARFAYVHAVALNSGGERMRAIATLEAAQKRHPTDRDILAALVEFNVEAGNRPAAIAWAKRLVERSPSDPNAARMLQSLQAPR
jgi:tetratricopeptide (TPR) repeat protein/nitrate/TMAO reductase-like tetraheme cytochrome c subunit